MNKIQIEEENINLNINKIFVNNIGDKKKIKDNIFTDNDINIDNLEFKNFCNDLSAKLFGNKL